ncbi:MAG TPA: hypothetical protein VGC85_00470, partial [Chthoniobacterales bacterium]
MTSFSKLHPAPWAEKVARLRWSHAALLLAGVFALANWQLIMGRAHEKWDAYALASPYFSVLAKSIRSGELLLW